MGRPGVWMRVSLSGRAARRIIQTSSVHNPMATRVTRSELAVRAVASAAQAEPPGDTPIAAAADRPPTSSKHKAFDIPKRVRLP